MNTLNKWLLMGVVGALAASSLAVAADASKAAAPEKKSAPAGSQRWSKNQADILLLKQDLEIRTLEQKIHDAENGVTSAAPGTDKSTPGGEVLVNGISTKDIFVDRVFGLESALQARVFFDSHIMTVSVNDEITDGIVVSGISARGISLRAGKNEKTVFIPLTTTAMAAEKAFPAGAVVGITTAPGGMGTALPPGAFPAGVLGMDGPPPITTGP